MNKHKTINLFLILSILLGYWVMSPQTVHACKCADMSDPSLPFRGRPIVFVGEAIHASEQPQKQLRDWLYKMRLTWNPYTSSFGRYLNNQQVTFKVEQAWQGVSGEYIILPTAYSGHPCNGTLHLHQRYLVYSEEGSDFLFMCDPSHMISTTTKLGYLAQLETLPLLPVRLETLYITAVLLFSLTFLFLYWGIRHQKRVGYVLAVVAMVGGMFLWGTAVNHQQTQRMAEARIYQQAQTVMPRK